MGSYYAEHVSSANIPKIEVQNSIPEDQGEKSPLVLEELVLNRLEHLAPEAPPPPSRTEAFTTSIIGGEADGASRPWRGGMRW